MTYLDFVFDAMPGPDGCRLVEVEDHHKRSVRVGKWMTRDDGHIVLRVSSDVAELEAENERLKVAFTRAHDLAEIVADEFRTDDGWGAYETYTEQFEFLRDERIAIDKKTADRIEGE